MVVMNKLPKIGQVSSNAEPGGHHNDVFVFMNWQLLAVGTTEQDNTGCWAIIRQTEQVLSEPTTRLDEQIQMILGLVGPRRH